MIQRELEREIRARMGERKAVIIMGPRQVGKSTLFHSIFDHEDGVLWLNADNGAECDLLRDASAQRIRTIVGRNRYLVIDEAQQLHNAGLTLKRIHDYVPEVQLFATGSSAFHLADKIKESLTGRKWEYRLYPLSFGEMVSHSNVPTEMSMLSHRMVYGYYPEVVSRPGDEASLLRMLADDYLYKDVLKLENIKRTSSLSTLTKALAMQIGSQVSYNELGQMVGLDSKTVEKYIDILEQSFIVFRLGSFSRNLRNELKKSRKIYFYDLGIRNAVLNNFTPLENRAPEEVGALWENFIIAERIKYCDYHGLYCNRYFWRTTSQQEIDYIEERNGQLHAFELKWNPRAHAKMPLAFERSYGSMSTFTVINRDNYVDYLITADN